MFTVTIKVGHALALVRGMLVRTLFLDRGRGWHRRQTRLLDRQSALQWARFPFWQRTFPADVLHYFQGKRGRHVLAVAWTFMLQRFHNYIERQRGDSAVECGMVIHDNGHEVEIRKLMRKLRVYNPVPSRYGGAPRNIPLLALVEDPVPRDSYHAQFIQLCDYLAYALLRREEPMTEKYPGLSEVFQITAPVILAEAARDDPDGIVRFPRT